MVNEIVTDSWKKLHKRKLDQFRATLFNSTPFVGIPITGFMVSTWATVKWWLWVSIPGVVSIRVNEKSISSFCACTIFAPFYTMNSKIYQLLWEATSSYPKGLTDEMVTCTNFRSGHFSYAFFLPVSPWQKDQSCRIWPSMTRLRILNLIFLSLFPDENSLHENCSPAGICETTTPKGLVLSFCSCDWPK